MVVRRWDEHDGHLGELGLERCHEGSDVLARPVLGVDHHRVGAALGHVDPGAGERVLEASPGDEALDAGHDHEVGRAQRTLARGDLGGELLWVCLLLHAVGAEERVLLEADLVLDDHGGDAYALERAHVVHEPLGAASRVSVEDDRLGGDLHDLLDGVEAAREVDELDVGLALERGVAQA